ncbi:unnamed protein product, partial [Rhizoctonia solani]
ARCWEHAVGSTHLDGMEDDKKEFHAKHGMFLPQVADCCTLFKSEDDGKIILRNGHGEYFAFSISLIGPAGTHDEGPNATHDVTVVHDVPFQLIN